MTAAPQACRGETCFRTGTIVDRHYKICLGYTGFLFRLSENLREEVILPVKNSEMEEMENTTNTYPNTKHRTLAADQVREKREGVIPQ